MQRELIEKSRQAIAALEKLEKRQILVLRSLLVGATVALVAAMVGGVFAVSQSNEAKKQLKLAQINQAESLGRYSNFLFNENKELEAFVTAINAGKILHSQQATNPDFSQVKKIIDK